MAVKVAILSHLPQELPELFADLLIALRQFVPVHDVDLAHVGQGGELVQIPPLGFQLGEHLVQAVHPDDPFAQAAQAQELSLTVTDYLCLCGLGKKIVQVDGLDPVLTELKAQGRNLNQLTTLANLGRITIVDGDRLAEGYGQVSEQLRQLLREAT